MCDQSNLKPGDRANDVCFASHFLRPAVAKWAILVVHVSNTHWDLGMVCRVYAAPPSNCGLFGDGNKTA